MARLLAPDRRRAWSLAHRWLGLAIAVFVTIAGLTGSAIAFWRELDAWLNPAWFRVEPGEERRPLSALLADVGSARPDSRVRALLLPDRPDAALVLMLSADAGGADELFVDPYTGTLLGERDTDAIGLGAGQLVPFLYRLHYSLKLGRFGEYLLGVAALAWLVAMLVGLALAWPRRGKWRQALSVKRSAGTPRMLFDLHRAAGLLSAAVFVVVAWTALWWNMDYAVRPALAALLPPTPWYPDTLPDTAPAPHDAGPDAALAAARAARPAGEAYLIGILPEKGLYRVVMKQPGEIGLYGRTEVFVSMDGADVGEPATHRPGDTYATWQLPLHTGQFLGLPGRVLWCVAGLAPLLLAATGTALWLRRRRVARRQGRGARQTAFEPAGARARIDAGQGDQENKNHS